jgi:hypothetical protein
MNTKKPIDQLTINGLKSIRRLERLKPSLPKTFMLFGKISIRQKKSTTDRLMRQASA